MKKTIICLLIILSHLSYSQMYVHNFVPFSIHDYIQISNNQHQFNYTTGISDTFLIPTRVYSVNIEENILHISFLYDLTYPVFGIEGLPIYYDSINYNQEIPSNVEYIKMSTNVVTIADNPPYNPITVEDV